MAHTPGPWRYERGIGCPEVVADEPRQRPRLVPPNWPATRKRRIAIANAEFIVKACNSYYPMLEALREIYEVGCIPIPLALQANQAIAKAEGRE